MGAGFSYYVCTGDPQLVAIMEQTLRRIFKPSWKSIHGSVAMRLMDGEGGKMTLDDDGDPNIIISSNTKLGKEISEYLAASPRPRGKEPFDCRGIRSTEEGKISEASIAYQDAIEADDDKNNLRKKIAQKLGTTKFLDLNDEDNDEDEK